uniref:Uncharacterized protein n=1 Tax=Anguilla anguilla TaxID=7936 RepID=A0A0E9P8J0_ANGAN
MGTRGTGTDWLKTSLFDSAKKVDFYIRPADSAECHLFYIPQKSKEMPWFSFQ